MFTIDRASIFWSYLSPGQKGLIETGVYLYEDLQKHPDLRITDYSYLVFPFAKAYEGFLKQLFVDLKFISREKFESDSFRIGKALNPSLEKRMRGESVYDKLVAHSGDPRLADKLWEMWKQGRNLLFHYFPHNLKAITLPEAETVIEDMINLIETTVTETNVIAAVKS